MAGLDNCAEALFLDAGQTACDVAGGRLTAAHVLADGLRAVFHPLDDLVNFLCDGAVGTADRTVGQNVLSAEEFGRFAEDDGRTEVNELVCHVADDTVGGHAGGRIRAAALDGHGQIGNIAGLALLAGDLHDKALCRVHAGLDTGGCAAELLNVDDLTRLAAGLNGLIDALMIGSLAAEAHDQRRADVCAQAEINENLRHTLEVRRQLAAALMMEVTDSALDLAADRLRHIVCTDGRRNDGDQISCAELSVRSSVALECIAHDASLLTDRRGREAPSCCGYGRIRPF